MSAYQCGDCRSVWESQAAADECFILDGEEARNARRPRPNVTRPLTRWEDD